MIRLRLDLIAAIAADPTADPIDAATDVPTAADALRRVFAAAHDERFAG